MLQPGDRIVELAGVVLSSAIATGAIASAWIMWLIKKSYIASSGAFVCGALLGFIIAQIVARLLYQSGGNTTVAKVGISSLSSTIPAGMAGGFATAIIVALVTRFVFSGYSQHMSLFVIALGCGIVIGILFACLGSLL